MMRSLAVAVAVAAVLAGCGHGGDDEPQPSAAAPPPITTEAPATTAAPATSEAPPTTATAPPGPPPSEADLEAAATLTVADVPVTLGQHGWCDSSGSTLACEEEAVLDRCTDAITTPVDAGQANVLTFPVQPDHVRVVWTPKPGHGPQQVLWDGGAEAGPFDLPVGTGLMDVEVEGPTFQSAYRACLTVRALS